MTPDDCICGNDCKVVKVKASLIPLLRSFGAVVWIDYLRSRSHSTRTVQVGLVRSCQLAAWEVRLAFAKEEGVLGAVFRDALFPKMLFKTEAAPALFPKPERKR